jgi:hypothetical protein
MNFQHNKRELLNKNELSELQEKGENISEINSDVMCAWRAHVKDRLVCQSVLFSFPSFATNTLRVYLFID